MVAKNPSKTLKKKPKLEQKLHKMLKTPASFAFFVSIHDFVEVIETDSALSRKLSRDLKYGHLKQIHRGIKDISVRGKASNGQEDLGHERYMVINDLNRIQKKETSDSNSFWKKRELFRKLALEIYDRLHPQPAEAKK